MLKVLLSPTFRNTYRGLSVIFYPVIFPIRCSISVTETLLLLLNNLLPCNRCLIDQTIHDIKQTVSVSRKHHSKLVYLAFIKQTLLNVVQCQGHLLHASKNDEFSSFNIFFVQLQYFELESEVTAMTENNEHLSKNLKLFSLARIVEYKTIIFFFIRQPHLNLCGHKMLKIFETKVIYNRNVKIHFLFCFQNSIFICLRSTEEQTEKSYKDTGLAEGQMDRQL